MVRVMAGLLVGLIRAAARGESLAGLLGADRRVVKWRRSDSIGVAQRSENPP
jgi:hypothetical protein